MPPALPLPPPTQGVTGRGHRCCLHFGSFGVSDGCRRPCSHGAPFPGQMFYLKKCAFWGPDLSSIELDSEGNKTQFFKNLLFF